MTTPSTSHEISAPIAPDLPDERDFEYLSSERLPPPSVGYDNYRRLVGETWHQRGEECTGFALAAIANYEIRRSGNPDAPSVSRRMLYEAAQLHDGQDFDEGSTLRGALRGWSRLGVARDRLWPYHPDDEFGRVHGGLTLARILDARTRPLMSYRRITAADPDTLRDALAEGHVAFASARLHVGWYRLFLPDVEPVIVKRPDDAVKGGHAFVVVGYDERGFWIHNSWGPEWGTEGYALISYDDWDAHRQDAWVVEMFPAADVSGSRARDPLPDLPEAAQIESTASYRDLWQHLVVLDDRGRLSSSGLYEMDKGSVGTLLYLFQESTAGWSRRRLAVIIDGGYRPVAATIERHRQWRDRLLAREIYPIFVVWETSWWEELRDEVQSWADRLGPDASIENGQRSAVRRSAVAPIWNQLTARARAACEPSSGGAALLAESIAYKRNQKWFDLHVVSHGVGDLLAGPLSALLAPPVTTYTALDPATPTSQFEAGVLPLLEQGVVENLAIWTFDDTTVDDHIGPAQQPFGELVEHVIGERPIARAGPGRPTDRSGRGGASIGLSRATVSASGHVGGGYDAELQDRVIARMLAHRSSRGEAAPGAAPSDESLPIDPLARAAAMRSRVNDRDAAN